MITNQSYELPDYNNRVSSSISISSDQYPQESKYMPMTPPYSPNSDYSVNISLTKENMDILANLPNIDQYDIPDEINDRKFVYSNASDDDLLFIHSKKKVEIQAIVVHTYFNLEFVGCLISNILIGCNIFLFALVTHIYERKDAPDMALRHFISRVVIIAWISLIKYVLTSPDTFKSVNLTMESLSINSIIYGYSLSIVIKYLFIHFITGIISAAIVVGTYYEYLDTFTSSELSSFILLRASSFVPESVSQDVKLTVENHKYKFGYSYFLITILAHAILGFGLSILTNTVNSLNVKKRVLQKGLLVFMINITFGIVIGPIGYTWPSLVLYIMMIIIRNDFDQLNTSIVITYTMTLTTIIIVYPIIAIKIKYFWHSKYRNYIEYYL